MSDNTFTTEDLAYLAAVEADYRADVEAVQRAADKAFDLWVEQARAVVEEAPVEKPAQDESVASFGTVLLVCAAVIIGWFALSFSLFALAYWAHWGWCWALLALQWGGLFLAFVRMVEERS